MARLQFEAQLTAPRTRSKASRGKQSPSLIQKGSGPWADLALTLPIFLGYHLGVVFLPLRNAADLVTHGLVSLASNSLLAYGGLTLGIGGVFVGVLVLLGRGQSLRWERFAMVAVEGIAYAIAMRLLAGFVVGRMHLSGGINATDTEHFGLFAGLVMSLGAGFYEEVAFRVLLFGVGFTFLQSMLRVPAGFRRRVFMGSWAVLAALAFSAWHYLGAFGEPFEPKSFVFRWVCGVIFTVIYMYRGFAPTVWTHTLYDAWVLVL